MGKQSGRGQVKNFIRAARGGCLAHLRETNKTCIDLTRGGGGEKNNAPVTNPLFWYFPRSLLERLEQNGHHAVMLS